MAFRTTDPLTAMHNRLAPEIVRRIVRDTRAAGGNGATVLTVLESIVAGVLFAAVRRDAVDAVLTTFVERVRARIAEIDRDDAAPARSRETMQ